MQLFGLLFIVPVCAILASICLRLAKKPVNLASITIFTLTGGVIGVFTMGLWAVLFANESGTIDSGISVIGMFLSAGVLAIVSGFFAISLIKNNRL